MTLSEARAFARELGEDGSDRDEEQVVADVQEYTGFYGFTGDEVIAILDAYNDGARSYL